MADEIFGPVLPVYAYSSRSMSPLRSDQRQGEAARALYIYSQQPASNIDRIIESTRAGGTCINHSTCCTSQSEQPAVRRFEQQRHRQGPRRSSASRPSRTPEASSSRCFRSPGIESDDAAPFNEVQAALDRPQHQVPLRRPRTTRDLRIERLRVGPDASDAALGRRGPRDGLHGPTHESHGIRRPRGHRPAPSRKAWVEQGLSYARSLPPKT